MAVSQSSSATADPPDPARCEDDIDNDGDTRTDYPNDPGCVSTADPDETDPPIPEQCSDGIDNDGDAKVDFPHDPGCVSTADANEIGPPGPGQCEDGADNDGDGLIDFGSDPGCVARLDDSELDGATVVREQSVLPARLLSPFPVVRIRGRAGARAVRLTLLTVRAPRGSRVAVSCRGRGCPRRRAVRVSRGRTLRFGPFERLLRPGAVLRIFVTKPDRIGKYTRFTIRRRRAPLRRDLCTLPGVERPTGCPLS